MGSVRSLLVVGGSALSFRLLNAAVGFLPRPEAARSKVWKWRNISTSLAHSALTGAGALSCFYLQPRMVEDLISFYSPHTHTLVAVSVGYFIHDFLDLACNQPHRQCWEVMLHHTMVTSCFGLAVKRRLFLGFAVVSLLVEVHSVFLHLRQLLLLSGRTNRPAADDVTGRRPSVAYSVACWLNLGTLLVFRLGTLCWMSRWLAGHRQRLSGSVLLLGAAGLGLVSAMSAVLLCRLLRADVLGRSTASDH